VAALGCVAFHGLVTVVVKGWHKHHVS